MKSNTLEYVIHYCGFSYLEGGKGFWNVGGNKDEQGVIPIWKMDVKHLSNSIAMINRQLGRHADIDQVNVKYRDELRNMLNYKIKELEEELQSR